MRGRNVTGKRNHRYPDGPERACHDDRNPLPDFEIFDRPRCRPNNDPKVTILRAGILSLNAVAYQALGQPSAVELMYDPAKRIVGLRAVRPNARHACFLRRASRSSRGRWLITAKAFLHHYDIDARCSRRWPAWTEGEILCFSLDDEGTVVTSNRPTSRPSWRCSR